MDNRKDDNYYIKNVIENIDIIISYTKGLSYDETHLVFLGSALRAGDGFCLRTGSPVQLSAHEQRPHRLFSAGRTERPCHQGRWTAERAGGQRRYGLDSAGRLRQFCQRNPDVSEFTGALQRLHTLSSDQSAQHHLASGRHNAGAGMRPIRYYCEWRFCESRAYRAESL